MFEQSQSIITGLKSALDAQTRIGTYNAHLEILAAQQPVKVKERTDKEAALTRKEQENHTCLLYTSSKAPQSSFPLSDSLSQGKTGKDISCVFPHCQPCLLYTSRHSLLHGRIFADTFFFAYTG